VLDKLTFRIPFLLLLAVPLLSGCVAVRHEPHGLRRTEYRELLVKSIDYDEKGHPEPGPAVLQRPSRPGEHFAVVSFQGERLLSSCDIAVLAERPDLRRPFRAVYEWTGKGFRVGMQATVVLMQGLNGTVSGPDALPVLAFVFAPVALGGVTGFVIGIGDGMVQTAVELRKFALGANEQVLTCTLYDYDGKGRLFRTRMFSPDRKTELVRTTFEYAGPGPEPARTVVESFVEDRQRDIR
jgi:hypothetical protein